MRGDLNERFQRAQAASGDSGPNKWLIALIIGLVLGFILMLVGGTIFFVKTIDKIIDTPSDSKGNTQYTTDGQFDPFSPSYGGGSGAGDGQSGGSSYEDITAGFKFGTVTGNSYYSEFSGVSFEAPADWNLTGYSESPYTNMLTPKDLAASNSNMSCSVSVSYVAMKARRYTVASDALKTHISTATTGLNNSMVDDSVTASYGGNSFTGIIYKKTMDSNYSYYTEVLVAEVNGYVLEIYVEANSEADLNAVMNMFK